MCRLPHQSDNVEVSSVLENHDLLTELSHSVLNPDEVAKYSAWDTVTSRVIKYI